MNKLQLRHMVFKKQRRQWQMLHADSDDPLGPERVLAKAVLCQAIIDKDWEFLSNSSLWHDLAELDPIQIGDTDG